MPTLRLSLLGSFQATLENTPLAFDTDKTRALLAYLAVEAQFPHQRERLAGLLWSDVPEKSALHNLRQALSFLRKTLSDEQNSPPFLLIQRDSVQINPESDFQLDAGVFERDLDNALKHYQHCHNNSDCRLNLRQLLRCVRFFRGPFLDQMYLNGSFLFDEWASLKREHLNRRMIEALSILADLYERRGEIILARQIAGQIVSLAPWDETAQVQLMRLLAVEGQWSAAQAQYRHLRRYLREQVGVEPAPETVSLFESIRRSAARNTPLQALHLPARHNLPLNGAHFFGRETELDALSDMLANPSCRLLTITGPGGVGKSRLALEAARHQVGVFKDGVHFVSLAALSSNELLSAVVSDTLGFVCSGGKTAANQLVDTLRDKHMLWLLDNMEQLLPLAGNSLIPQVLQNAPGIVILSTSRQRLNLQEECIFPIKGLPYPEQADCANSADYAALQLFASQAQRVHPAFKLGNPADLHAAVQICKMVEGLPLGVELAAAALWSRTASDVAADLGANINILASPAVNAIDRHRSLLAAFEVSWKLLLPEEQSLLGQLSVFRGGFESEMATQWMGAPFSLLASLQDKSLLRRTAAGRFDMHEAIRQFAETKLARNVERSTEAFLKHAQGFTNLLATRLNALKSTGQVQALAEIASEWENVRQAWSWLAAQGQGKALAESAEAIFHFCNIRSRYQEGIDLFKGSLNSLEKSPKDLAAVLTFQGALAYRALKNDLCESSLQRALALFERIDSPNNQALALVFASALAVRQKDHQAARQLCEQALDLFTQTGDRWGQSYAWYQLGLLESRTGKTTEAQKALQSSLEAAYSIGDQRRQIGPLNMLGDLACQLGAYGEAQGYFEKSLELSRALEDPFNTALALGNLGTTFHYSECYEQAQRCYVESLAISQESNDLAGQSLTLTNLGELALAQGKYEEGLTYFKKALTVAYKADDEWSILICQINLADAALGLGDTVTAGRYLAQSLPLADQSGEPALILRNLLHQGRLQLMQGQIEKGTTLLGLVLHHQATYAEHRTAALQTLTQAGLPVPSSTSITIEDAHQLIDDFAA